MAEIIAERVLEVVGGQPDALLTVRLGKPILNEEAGNYSCPFEISGLSLDIKRFATGLDAMQSIQLAFVMIGGNLAFLERTKGVIFKWCDGDSGFPRP